MKLKYFVLFCLSFIVLEISSSSSLENPYKPLGIDKKASLQEVKKAYKQLAKEWYAAINENTEFYILSK
jgi:DnaJ homolog subfamily C member 16